MLKPVVGYVGANGTVVAVLDASVVVESVTVEGPFQVEMPISDWVALEEFAG